MSAQSDADSPVISLRLARTGDEPRLSLLGGATFLESYAHMLPVTDVLAHVARQHAAEVYARWLIDPACRCWLLECEPGHAPVGYAVVTPPDLPLSDLADDDLEIRRIYLLHKYQRGGRGRQLMQAVREHARAAGARRLLLGVYSRNAVALAFYERQGFSRAGTRQFRVGANDYFDYILQLVL
ncbi:MAG TPA: GNAT family N-acetyltransferase [Steroidobacteraceae bacterium]|nr:GNAT family N-acetyltransferase [Steroidobacteraceae bacterium]